MFSHARGNSVNTALQDPTTSQHPPRIKTTAHNLCRMALLVLAPHTTMCRGVESFTEENRSSLHVGTYISVTVSKVTPIILHEAMAPEYCGSSSVD